jgi:hypothetical protein
MHGAIPPLPQYDFLAWCSVKKKAHRQIYLHLLHIKVKSELRLGLHGRGARVRFPAGAENFCLYHRVRNGSGAHPASYPMITRGSFPGGKAVGS